MAFIQGQDEEQQEGQAPLIGGGTASVSGPTGGGGPAGAGGSSGGWVNIQNYLNANKNDTGSAQALNKTVGDQFGKEREAFQGDSAAFLQNAQSQVDKSKISNEDADAAIKQAGSQYQYGKPQSEEYTGTVDRFQNALAGQYAGPKEYSYGFGGQTQDYGSSLKDQGGFDRLMSHIYSQNAKAPLSSGQFELQKQFDVNNASLADARQNLGGQFDQLGKDRDAVVKNTTDSLGGLEKQFRTNQNALRDYLTGQSNQYEENIGRAEADARAQYDKLFREGRTGQSAIGYNSLENTRGNNPGRDARLGAGIYGSDLTWDQLQRENSTLVDTPLMHPGGGKISWIGAQPELDRRRQALDQFYAGQDAQYGNTADAEERWFNTVQDFLGSDAKRKEQGFKVRG